MEMFRDLSNTLNPEQVYSNVSDINNYEITLELYIAILKNTKRQVQMDKEEAEISSKAAQERTTHV